MPMILNDLLDQIDARDAAAEFASINPAAPCVCCDGRGYVIHEQRPAACWGCGGKATTGAFVIQLQTVRWRYELKFVSQDYFAALRHAQRSVRHLAGRPVMGSLVLWVRVVFSGPEGQRVVQATPVPGRRPAAVGVV